MMDDARIMGSVSSYRYSAQIYPRRRENSPSRQIDRDAQRVQRSVVARKEQ